MGHDRNSLTAHTADEQRQHRREYQHAYYLAHRERFCQYQREYNRTHKRSTLRYRGGLRILTGPAVTKGRNYTRSDVMQMPTEKTLKVLQAILRGTASLAP